MHADVRNPVPTVRVWAGAVYPEQAASTRLRLGVLREPLAAGGSGLTEWTYLANEDLQGWIGGGLGRLGPSVRGVARARRGEEQVGDSDVVIVQRELVPWNTLAMERRVTAGRKFVWDVDDAMWNVSAGLRARVRGGEAKYEWLARSAAQVWAGNHMVAEWCVAHGAADVRIVPTVTPIPPRVGTPADPPRLAWVGTPSTGTFLEQLLFANADALSGWVVEVVGAQVSSPPDVRVEKYPWSEANESRALTRAWAGLYPIDTVHPLASGKSALKAVLMGAYGLPVIATRTRSNAAVIEDGVTGLLVDGVEGWRVALAEVAHPEVRASMGRAARLRVEKDFNPRVWGERLAGELTLLAG